MMAVPRAQFLGAIVILQKELEQSLHVGLGKQTEGLLYLVLL